MCMIRFQTHTCIVHVQYMCARSNWYGGRQVGRDVYVHIYVCVYVYIDLYTIVKLCTLYSEYNFSFTSMNKSVQVWLFSIGNVCVQGFVGTMNVCDCVCATNCTCMSSWTAKSRRGGMIICRVYYYLHSILMGHVFVQWTYVMIISLRALAAVLARYGAI